MRNTYTTKAVLAPESNLGRYRPSPVTTAGVMVQHTQFIRVYPATARNNPRLTGRQPVAQEQLDWADCVLRIPHVVISALCEL